MLNHGLETDKNRYATFNFYQSSQRLISCHIHMVFVFHSLLMLFRLAFTFDRDATLPKMPENSSAFSFKTVNLELNVWGSGCCKEHLFCHFFVCLSFCWRALLNTTHLSLYSPKIQNFVEIMSRCFVQHSP